MKLKTVGGGLKRKLNSMGSGFDKKCAFPGGVGRGHPYFSNSPNMFLWRTEDYYPLSSDTRLIFFSALYVAK